MRPMGTAAYGGKGQGKGKGRGEGRLGHGGRGRSKGGEKPMGTTAYGGKGSKGRAANGDRPVGAASCKRDHHAMASCQNSSPFESKNEEGKGTRKPDGELILVPSKGQSRGGDEPPATEIHTGEPRPCSDKETRSTDGDGGTAADGPPPPPPNATGTTVNIGCTLTITTRRELSRQRSREQGQTIGRGEATPKHFSCQDGDRHRPKKPTNNEVYTCTEFFSGGPMGPQQDARFGNAS